MTTANAADNGQTHRDCLGPDDLAAAWLTGFDAGRAARREHDIEDELQRRAHAYALELLGLARRQATDNHGPAWAEMVAGDAL